MSLSYSRKLLDEIKAAQKKWQENVEQAIAARSERDRRFTTVSGREINPLYTPADVINQEFERDIGFPGEYPFTRGVQPSMYRGRLWTMRMFAGLGTARDTQPAISPSRERRSDRAVGLPLICPP